MDRDGCGLVALLLRDETCFSKRPSNPCLICRSNSTVLQGHLSRVGEVLKILTKAKRINVATAYIDGLYVKEGDKMVKQFSILQQF